MGRRYETVSFLSDYGLADEFVGVVKGVLEVIGGTAKKYGIGPGDRVGHPLFDGDH